MSYSRWSNSCWYVFHDACSGESKESQVLTVCDHGSWTYETLQKEKSQILDSIRSLRFNRNPLNYKGAGETPDRFTEEEVQELSNYITMFIEDMDFQFNKDNIEKYGDLVRVMGRG